MVHKRCVHSEVKRVVMYSLKAQENVLRVCDIILSPKRVRPRKSLNRGSRFSRGKCEMAWSYLSVYTIRQERKSQQTSGRTSFARQLVVLSKGNKKPVKGF